GGVPTDRPAGRVDPLPESRDARGTVADVAVPRVPRVDVGQRDRQHPLAVRADEERRTAGPRGAGQELAVARFVELPGEVDVAVAKQRADDRERFLEPGDAAVEREAERSIFRLVPSRAEPEDEPPAAHLA